MTVPCSSVCYVHQLKHKLKAILYILIMLIFTVCSIADYSQQVKSSKFLQGGNPLVYYTYIAVLQDQSPAGRKWHFLISHGQLTD